MPNLADFQSANQTYGLPGHSALAKKSFSIWLKPPIESYSKPLAKAKGNSKMNNRVQVFSLRYTDFRK